MREIGQCSPFVYAYATAGGRRGGRRAEAISSRRRCLADLHPRSCPSFATTGKHYRYRRRPLDLPRQWHTKLEGWSLEQAGAPLRRVK
ncbi:hypothetical protein CKO27_13325 [Thiocystis violacea]|nr:hypothetical protein [Thiocystis violacea]